MGTVLDMETFRKGRPGGPEADERTEPYSLINEIEGRCPGCGARWAHLTVCYDAGPGKGTSLFWRTLPHYLCDRERVTIQEYLGTPDE
ncbi:MAG: hypothetical protein ACRD1B_11245 [Thermoanaerobaculia bacterium]